MKLHRDCLSRRAFLKSGAAGSVALALPASMAWGATPKKGGTLRVGLGAGSTNDPIDPGLYESNFTVAMTHGYNGYLTQVATDGSLAPSVAESWETNEGATLWTFSIRKGVEFHDGRKVTAKDVIASLNHHRGDDTSSTAKPLLEAITDLRADGDYTVVVTLSQGNADFPFIMTDYHLPVMRANPDGTMEWKSMIGCGPYKVDNYQGGEIAELSRHENHWDKTVAHVDKVQLLVLQDPNARTTALLAGDVDAIDRVDVRTAGKLGTHPNINVHSVTGTQHYTFPMRADTSPFTDNNVRRALKFAINRQEMLDKILFGYGTVGNDIPIGSGQRFYNDQLPQTEYDPDQAKYYLKQAGLESLRVSLSAADAAYAGAVDAAVLFQNSAAETGIKIDAVREPNDGYWSEVWMKKPFVTSYFGGRPVEDMVFSIMYETGAAWNDTFWSNERFDTILNAARSETDTELRREMYYEMQDILHDQGAAIIPMFASYVFATRDTVGHEDDFSSHFDMDGYRFMERWWKV